MELILVRHAEPDRAATGHERRDPGLSEYGMNQTRLVARYLAEEDRFDGLYSSPLRRARETAEGIAARLGLPVSLVDGLAEFDRNAPEYLHFDDLRKAKDPRYSACIAGDLSAWGTDVERFRAEFTAGIESIVRRHRTGRVLAVTHGGVLNGYLGSLVGTDRFFFHRPGNTGISRVQIEDDRARLVSLNELAHLRPGVARSPVLG